MGAASLLVALALAAEHGFATSSISGELRAAAPLSGSTAAGLTPELSLRPSVDVGWVAGLFRVTGGYHPQVTVTGLSTPALLHRAQAGVEWRLSASRRLQVDQALVFGQYDTSLGNLGAGGTPPPVGLPLGILVDYLTSDTAVTWDGAIAPRLRLRTALGYHASGGLTEEARRGIPLQHGPRMTLEFQHAATRRDAISTQVRLSADQYLGEQFLVTRTSAIAEGALTWRSTLTRDLGLRLGGGVAAVASVAPGETPAPRAVPVASANLSYGLPRMNFALDAAYSPQADALSGQIFQRAGVGVSADYRPRSDLTARGSFGGSWSVAGQNAGDRTLLGEASIAYRERPLEISVGARVADVALAASTPSHATELRAFVGFSLQGPAVR